MIDNKTFIFVGGMHRSGTSLLHQLLKSHPDVSGFSGTGVPQDEGQHLQSLFPAARELGGAGRFGFNPKSKMNEYHASVSDENSSKLFAEWSRYWDTEKAFLLEKSPPNLVRTRFLQALFPKTRFIVIMRHPIAIAYATRKMSRLSTVPSLIDHTLNCYETFLDDLPHLAHAYILRYEDLVAEPSEHVQSVVNWLGLGHLDFEASIRQNVNQKYFTLWEESLERLPARILRQRVGLVRKRADIEKRMRTFGYSLTQPECVSTPAWLGPKG
jgi:hypothetical protein